MSRKMKACEVEAQPPRLPTLTIRVQEGASASTSGPTRSSTSQTVHSLSTRMAFTVSNSGRSEEHTSELQSLMRTSYAVVSLKETTTNTSTHITSRPLLEPIKENKQ